MVKTFRIISTEYRGEEQKMGVRHSHKNRQRKKKPKTQQSSFKGLEHYLANYQQLMTHHLEARAEYYNFFYRSHDRERKRLEKNFSFTMKSVRDFEKSIPPKFREGFLKKVEMGHLDLTYSQNHKLQGPDNPRPNPEESAPSDPHLLRSQQSEDYKNDTEEGTGTMEDYKKLKELTN